MPIIIATSPNNNKKKTFSQISVSEDTSRHGPKKKDNLCGGTSTFEMKTM